MSRKKIVKKPKKDVPIFTQAQKLKALSRTLLMIQQYRIANQNRLVQIPSFLGSQYKGAKSQKKTALKKLAEKNIPENVIRKSRAEVLDELFIEAPPKFPNWKDFFKDKLKIFSETETLLQKKIMEELDGHPIWENFLSQIKGVGPVIASSLIGEIGDINKFEKTSNLWAFAGKAVKDGKAIRRKRGEKSNFNRYLSLCLWKFGSSILKVGTKVGSPYLDLYKKRKRYEKKMHDETCRTIQEKGKCTAPKLHIHLRALRYVEKKFLSDLFHYWKDQSQSV